MTEEPGVTVVDVSAFMDEKIDLLANAAIKTIIEHLGTNLVVILSGVCATCATLDVIMTAAARCATHQRQHFDTDEAYLEELVKNFSQRLEHELATSKDNEAKAPEPTVRGPSTTQ